MAAGVDGGLADDDRQLVDDVVHRADLDGMVRLIDEWTSAQNWVGLLAVRDRARAAVSTGRQLWPAATLAEYRLALHAPPQWSATVLDESSGRFTIGPLIEVAAMHHSPTDLAPFLDDPIRLGWLAHERAMRTQGAVDLPGTAANPLEIPIAVQPWEPQYPLATYSDDGVDAPSPEIPGRSGGTRPTHDRAPVGRQASNAAHAGVVEVIDDPDTTDAVRQLFDSWTADSNGRVEMVCVRGRAADAVTALGVAHAELHRLTLADALAWLAWAGASGGAHGRRRGAASGRFAAWWLLATLTDLADPWPPDPDELAQAASALEWFWWDAGEPLLGWTVQLAVAEPGDHNQPPDVNSSDNPDVTPDVTSGGRLAWAISARDAT